MIYNSDKTLIIQDLQCKLSSWLTTLNKNLSLNTCVDESNLITVQATNLINVLYRYNSFTSIVTNAQKIEFTYTTLEESDFVTIEIYEDLTLLATYSGIDTLSVILNSLCNQINTNLPLNYVCIVQDNCLYLYTYDVAKSYSDNINVIITETDTTSINVTSEITPILTDNLNLILDSINCLTLDDTCNIIKKIKSLIKNCNCN